jgi:hypothetical protein
LDRFCAFGLRRFICPGKFLVAAEISATLLTMLQHWDIRLAQKDVEVTKKIGRVSAYLYGFEMLADGAVGVEVKRRE